MSSHESSTEKKKAATEAMLKAINTQAPLPIDVIKQWLAVSELSYQKFADLMGCSLAAAKNWLCSYKEIPKKWDEEVRQRIQMKISCDSSFRAGAFSAAAANSGQQAPTEEELTYKIDPSLYGILSRIATMSRSTVFQIISDAVYSWSGDLIERSVFTRPAIAVEKLKVIAELKRFAEEHNEFMDWDDIDDTKWGIMYNHTDKTFYICCQSYIQIGMINFSSKEIAQKAIEYIGEDRLKKYYFEVQEEA